MSEIFLIGIKVDELISKITQAITHKVDSKSKLNFSNPETKYLSRFEVAKLLKISLPTLHLWTKHGLLQSYKIGNRVLYKQEEVEKSIHQVSNFKHKKFIQ